jgi:hypothetical protein
MTGSSTAERLRKVASGVCLILAPIGLTVGIWMHPKESFDPEKQLAFIAADPDRWANAHWIISASAVFLAGAVLALAHLLHERRPGHAIVGGAMGMVGAMSLMAVAFAEGAYAADMGRVGGAGTLEAFTASATAPAFPIISVGAMLGPLGLLTLGAGAFRAGVVPRWAAAATMVAGLAVAVSLPFGLLPLAIAGSALLFVGLAPIGLMVLRETDEEWAHTPGSS